MFNTISAKPRKIVRWHHGKRTEALNVIPIPFGKDRATEIRNKAIEATKFGPWTDHMADQMTDSEIAYVHAVWDCMDGRSSFYNAFSVILQGAVESYFKQYNKL